MMQVSMFILVMLSTTHSLTLVGVLVSPHGNGTSMAKASTAVSDQAVVSPQHSGVPRSPAFAGAGTQHLPAQVAAVELPPDTTSSNSSFSPLFTRKKPRGWSH